MKDKPVIIAVGRAGTLVLGLATTLLIARQLGPSGRGETAAALSAFFIVPILVGLGLPLVVRRMSAHGEAQEAVRSARWLSLILTPLSIAIGFALALTIFHTSTGEVRAAVVVGVSLAPVMILWLCDESVLVAQYRYSAVALVQLSMPVAFTALCGIMWAADAFTVTSVLCASIASNLVSLIVSTSLTRVPLVGASLSLVATIKESVTYAGAQAAEAAARRLDQVLLLPVIGATQLGLYSVGATVALMPLALAYAITARTYTEIATAEGEQRHEFIVASVRASFYWAAAATVFNVLVASNLIPFVFGPDFQNAVVPAMIASAGTLGIVTAQVSGSALAAQNRGVAMTFGQLLGLVIDIVLIFVVASKHGAVGAAIASTAGYFVTMIYLLVCLGVRPSDFAPRRDRLIDAWNDVFA